MERQSISIPDGLIDDRNLNIVDNSSLPETSAVLPRLDQRDGDGGQPEEGSPEPITFVDLTAMDASLLGTTSDSRLFKDGYESVAGVGSGTRLNARKKIAVALSEHINEIPGDVDPEYILTVQDLFLTQVIQRRNELLPEDKIMQKKNGFVGRLLGRAEEGNSQQRIAMDIVKEKDGLIMLGEDGERIVQKIADELYLRAEGLSLATGDTEGYGVIANDLQQFVDSAINKNDDEEITLPRELVFVYNAVRIAYENKVYELQLKEEIVSPSETVADANHVDVLEAVQEVGLQVTNMNSLSEDLRTELTLLDQADPSILIGIQSLTQKEQAERRQQHSDAMTRLKDYAVSKLKPEKDNSEEQPEAMLNRLVEERIVRELRLEIPNLANVSDEKIIKDIKERYHKHDSESPKLDSEGNPISSYDQYLRVIKNDIINEKIDDIIQNANRQLIIIRNDEDERNVPLSERTVITARESAKRDASQNLDLIKQAEIYESQRRPEKPWVTKLKNSKLGKNLKLIASSAGVKDGSSGAVMGARIVGLVMTFAGVAGAISEMRSQDIDEDNHDFNPSDSLADYEAFHHAVWYQQTGDTDVDEVHSNVMSELFQRWENENTTDDSDVLSPIQHSDSLSDNSLDDDITTSSEQRGGRIGGGLASMAMTEDELQQLAELEEQQIPQADFETGEPENSTEIPPQNYTVTVDGTGQSFNLDPNLVITVLEQFGVDEDVLNAEIPDGMTLNIGGMTLRINSEAADATTQQDNPDFETTFNPAALASLLGNETLTDLAEDIADRAKDIVEDQIAKMGVEQVFEEIVEEVSEYESLARALGEKGLDLAAQAPNEDVKVVLNTGALKPFGELLKHGVLTNVNGVDWNGLQNVGEEITVVLHDGNIGTFTNAHEAISALYKTITNLLPDGFEITLEGDSDLVLGKNKEVAPEVLVNVFTDPEKLNELQRELEDKGINIFNLVGLNQTEEGKIEIPEETINTVKAIVGAVAETVVAVDNSLDESNNDTEPLPQTEVGADEANVRDTSSVQEEDSLEQGSELPEEESTVAPLVEESSSTETVEQVNDKQNLTDNESERQIPEFMTITFKVFGTEQSYRIPTGSIADVLDNIGLRDDVLGSYIPGSLDGNIAGIEFKINTGGQTDTNMPVFDSSFNPAAIAALSGNPEIAEAAEGIYDTVMEIAEHQATKMGVEEVFKNVVSEASQYEGLAQALGDLGIDVAAGVDEDISVQLNSGALVPFLRMLESGVEMNVDGDSQTLINAGQEIKVVLSNGNVEGFTSAHDAARALYETVTRLIPEGYEVELGDGIVIGRDRELEPQTIIKLFTDPDALNTIQLKLNDQGVNIFELVGLEQGDDGGVEIPQETIDTVKAIVGGVAGAITGGGEEPAPEVLPQVEEPQPVEIEVGEPVKEEGITNEQPVPAEEAPVQADSPLVEPNETTNTVFTPGVFAQGDGTEPTNEFDTQTEQKAINLETEHWTTPLSELDEDQLKQRMDDVEQTLNNVRGANDEERGNLQERQTINVDSIKGLTQSEIERIQDITPEQIKTYEGDVAKLLAEEFGINPSVAIQVAAVVENAETVDIINRVLELEVPENIVTEEAPLTVESENPLQQTTENNTASDEVGEAEVVEEEVEAEEVESTVETQTTPFQNPENEVIDEEPIIKSFKVSAGGSLSAILNQAGLQTNDLYGEDGAIEQLESNSIAVIDGKAYILVNDDPSTTTKVFNVINPRSDMQGTPEGARLIVLELPDNVTSDTDSLINNILDPVRNVLRNQELTVEDGQALDDAFNTLLESVNREVHNLPEESTVENNADATPATATNTANIPFVATPSEPQTQEYVDTSSDHWQSRIEELDANQLEQRISDSQTTLNNVRLATEVEKDTLHERQTINVYSIRMLSPQQIAQLGDITPELIAQYEGDVAELITVEFGMNGSIAKQVAAVIENAPTVEIINRVLDLKGVETAQTQTTTETAQAPFVGPEIPVTETPQETTEVPVESAQEVTPAEETTEQIPTEAEPPLAQPEVVEEELKFPEFMQITFNINGFEQTYRISTAQISEILQNVGYENEVLEAYIPDNISGSIAGIGFTISSEGADSNANTPVIDSSFNPAALAALTGNQDLVEAAEGIYDKVIEIVRDQATKMGVENAFETAMAEAGKYESLIKALVALGVENAPNENIRVNIDTGPLAPFGRLIQEGIQANVNGDFSGLEAAGQQITVLLQDGSVGSFVNSHAAINELYNTITSLLPDGYELVIEGENGDIILGKGHDIPEEVLVQVLSDPKYLNLIQKELEEKGINIFNLVGLNQTEEGKIEIPQSTIDTFKAIVGGVAGAVTAGAEALEKSGNAIPAEEGTTEPAEEVPEQPLSAGEATFPTEVTQDEAQPADVPTEPSEGNSVKEEESVTEEFPETESASTPVEYQDETMTITSEGDYEWELRSFIAPANSEDVKFYSIDVNDVTDDRSNKDFNIIFRTPTPDLPEGSIQISYVYGDWVSPGEVMVYSGPLVGFENAELAKIDETANIPEDTQILVEQHNEGIDRLKKLVSEAGDLFDYITNFSEGNEPALTAPTADSEETSEDGVNSSATSDQRDNVEIKENQTDIDEGDTVVTTGVLSTDDVNSPNEFQIPEGAAQLDGDLNQGSGSTDSGETPTVVDSETWQSEVEDAFINSTYEPEKRSLSQEWGRFVRNFESYVAEVKPELQLVADEIAAYLEENPINGKTIRNVGLSISGLLLGTVMTRFNKERRQKLEQTPVRYTQQQKWIDNFRIKNNSDKLDMVLGSAGIVEQSPYGVQKQAVVFNPYNKSTEKVTLNGSVRSGSGIITVTPEQEVRLHSIFSGGFIPRRGIINVIDNSERLNLTLKDIQDNLESDNHDLVEEIVSEAISSGIMDNQLSQDVKDVLSDVISSSKGDPTPTGLFNALVQRITDLLLNNELNLEIGQMDGMPEGIKIQVLKLIKA